MAKTTLAASYTSRIIDLVCAKVEQTYLARNGQKVIFW